MAEDMRIVGLATDNMGCGYYRLINPIRALRDLGYDATCTTSIDELRDLSRSADVLILQRCSVPLHDEIRQWSRSGKLVIYELDDLIHDVPQSNPVFNMYKEGSSILKSSTANMVACDGMIVSSLELERYYRRLNRNIVRIPNFIDFRFRDWESPYPKVPGRIAVGWTGGSQHQEEAPLIWSLLNWAVSSYHLDVVLYCHPHFARYLLTRGGPLPPDRLILLPVRPFGEYPRAIGAMDIGLAPLTNIAFNRARCLDAGTAVWSPSGIRPISSLKVGDWVWNGERYVHVIARYDEGSTFGLRVRLECGLTLVMTTDHRVLSSIGWLNAGRLRRGDSLLISVPHYAGGVVKREPGQVASIFALLYLRGLSLDRRRQLEEELGMLTEQVRKLVDKGLMSLFDGWGDREAVNFFHDFFGRFATRNRRGELAVEVHPTAAQRLAECALIAKQKLSAKFLLRYVRLTLQEGLPSDYSRIVSVDTHWLDAVDIQVEGEVFCANGVVSHNSALKPLEYMARGVVCIASDVAEYRLLQKEGAPLLLARDEREWREHLSRLIEDEDYRRSFRVREWVMSHYDLHANAERYIQAIHQIREWKRRGIGGKGEYRPIKPHDRCPCGSGLKYSRCCYPAFG